MPHAIDAPVCTPFRSFSVFNKSIHKPRIVRVCCKLICIKMFLYCLLDVFFILQLLSVCLSVSNGLSCSPCSCRLFGLNNLPSTRIYCNKLSSNLLSICYYSIDILPLKCNMPPIGGTSSVSSLHSCHSSCSFQRLAISSQRIFELSTSPKWISAIW